jgi:hypothetical protein
LRHARGLGAALGRQDWPHGLIGGRAAAQTAPAASAGPTSTSSPKTPQLSLVPKTRPSRAAPLAPRSPVQRVLVAALGVLIITVQVMLVFAYRNLGKTQ